MTLSVPLTSADRDSVRVFAVNLPEVEARRATLTSLLGIAQIDTNRAELFAVSDLEGVGLPLYLTEGLGLPEAPVNADKARLSALEGYVLILPTAALPDLPVTLTLGPNLTLIGTYKLDPMRIPLTPLTSDGAQGSVPGGQSAPAPMVAMPFLLRATLALLGLLGAAIVVFGVMKQTGP